MMQGKLIHDQIEGRQLVIYLPPNYEESKEAFPVIYAHDGKEIEKLISNMMPQVEHQFNEEGHKAFILVGIYSDERIHEYTPWPAPALGERFEDFKGQGKSYLSFIVEQVIPYINETYRTLKDVKDTALMGYSLGGLISIYAAYETKTFGKIASISGSFWYQNMVDYVKVNEVLNKELEIFMSYGKAEGCKKQNRQAQAVPCAQEVSHILRKQLGGTENFYVYTDDGGHHEYASLRYQRALEWLSKKFK